MTAHDHGSPLPDGDETSEIARCAYILRNLRCGCQDVEYACGYTDREHDHVECDGLPLS